MVWHDPIVEEIRRVRDAHAARFGYDLDKIVADLKRQERESGRRLVQSDPRPDKAKAISPDRDFDLNPGTQDPSQPTAVPDVAAHRRGVT